jgi:RNA polymerase primary sigma factor
LVFGSCGGFKFSRTLEEVGRTFNITRERIRQIEDRSLKRLQMLAQAEKLDRGF